MESMFHVEDMSSTTMLYIKCISITWSKWHAGRAVSFEGTARRNRSPKQGGSPSSRSAPSIALTDHTDNSSGHTFEQLPSLSICPAKEALPAKDAEHRLPLQSFQALAQRLPYAKHVHSRLVCAVTKEVMDEHNPPIVLPNGTVYSERAIDQGIVNDSFADPVSGPPAILLN